MTDLYNGHGIVIPDHATHDLTFTEFMDIVDEFSTAIPSDEFGDFKLAFDTAWFTDTPVATHPTPVLRSDGTVFHILYVDNPYAFRPVGTVSDAVTVS